LFINAHSGSRIPEAEAEDDAIHLYTVRNQKRKISGCGFPLILACCESKISRFLRQRKSRAKWVTLERVLNFILISGRVGVGSLTMWVGSEELYRGRTVRVQTMDELELDDFRHGGVNITGFSLLDDESARLRAFQREWSHLDPRYWLGAGRGRRITVSISDLE